MSSEPTLKRKAQSEEVEMGVKHVAREEEQTIEADGESATSRMDQFRALRMRMKDSKKQNRQDLFRENARMKEDPKALKKLDLQASVAAEKLAKLDAGSDYERKRAWDWSIEESEAWDERVAQRKVNEARSGFADYTQEAAKQYIRNTKSLKPDLATYRRSTTLADTESPSTSLVDNLAFVHQKPKKENIDQLVADLSRADAARLKAQIKRGRAAGDDGDYINDRNKVFNQKVSRFYDKYTKEMKDSFERGTAQ